MTQDQRARIDLTPSQQRQVKTALGHDLDTTELSVEQLEDRIAPLSCANGTHYPPVVIT